MESFGCCSHYKECSDNGSCLFSKNDIYAGCVYSKNLLQGFNFYSTKIQEKVVLQKEKQQMVVSNIFLDCYDRNFKISRLSQNGFAYPLEPKHLDLISTIFTEKNIPWTLTAKSEKCVLEGDISYPANSRVIFTIEGEEFLVANFNSCFILKKYADGIIKAFIKKGISAKLNLIGKYANITTYPSAKPIRINEQLDIKQGRNLISDIKNKQLSVWELGLAL